MSTIQLNSFIFKTFRYLDFFDSIFKKTIFLFRINNQITTGAPIRYLLCIIGKCYHIADVGLIDDSSQINIKYYRRVQNTYTAPVLKFYDSE